MEIVDGKEREIVCVLEIGFEIVDHVESSDRGFEIVGNLNIILDQKLSHNSLPPRRSRPLSPLDPM